MKIVAIVGSIRRESYNKKIVEFMKERYKDKMDIEILPIEELPMYNEDIELSPPSSVKEIKDKIKSSDGILIATPEYNHSIPGVLKNALDWFSRVDYVMMDKPSMVIGASQGGFGTNRAQMHLRQILNSGIIGTINLPRNELFISKVQDKVDESGKLIDESTIRHLDKVVDNFIEWTDKVR
ncbi:MAG: NADPH-dependent FMN reductase [Tissierellaceae bacterium]